MSLLLGAQNTDPRDGTVFCPFEQRIGAGVLFDSTGNGGTGVSENGRKLLPFYGLDFSTMHAPTLTIGSEDGFGPHLTIRGANWHWDSYTNGYGSKDLLRVKGGHHGFGGISGWDAVET
ncbi:hypothetical protein E0Z10_g9866 [Xylaria hypoxylon]|uniref:Esterase n=1 Tax=Xylaria hypoxylon TaxID=37992 RepID=A0A4Z0Y545_9PEZI|nr:hypothetical protein E0Z10_g9866 [Xylaria hypoxylon]